MRFVLTDSSFLRSFVPRSYAHATAVQPRQTSSPDGGGKREERDSYAVDIGPYPYHPIHFDRRPILAGPAPPSHNMPMTSWRSADLIST